MRLLALVFALLAAACGGYRGIRAAQLTPFDGRSERLLERQARGELGCPEVRLIPLGESVVQVDGCARVAEYALFCFDRRRCDWRALEGVARHAERDLGCPGGALSISATGPTQRTAIGCGRTLRYTLTCSAEHCAWAPDPVPASPPPAAVMAVAPATGSSPPAASGSTDDLVIPPPPGSTPSAGTGEATPATSPDAGTDDLVIPPPPS